MTHQQLLDSIQNNFPEIRWQAAQFIDTGWDSRIVILDNDIVFRFPKKEETREHYLKEKKLLDILHMHVTLPIPQYTFIPANNEFVGYKMIKGEVMTKERYDGLTTEEKGNIQKQLGQFITELHSMPVEEFIPAGYEYRKSFRKEKRIKEFQKEFSDNCRYLFTEKELQSIHTYIEELGKMDYPHKTMVHADLQGKNIVVDPATHAISGIIDFTDSRIADPALDFDKIREYGKEFVDGVYANYSNEKKEGILERSLFYRKRNSLYELINAVEKQQDIDIHFKDLCARFF